jgi:glycosyltransferase involved in cell wall biosynthesis
VDGGAQNRSIIPSLIDKLGINHLVTFTGKISIERLNRLYSETEIAVAPSLYEGFGFPAAEAMACELPVIAAESGALPEVVGEHMHTGYLVPPRDSEALARGLDFLLTNPSVRKKLGTNGKKRVKNEFRWEKAAEEMIQIFRETADAHS